MDFIRHLEDDLRVLISENRKKNQDVKESAENSLSSLRKVREIYSSNSNINNNNNNNNVQAQDTKNNVPGPTHPIFQTIDIIHPFFLTCSHPHVSAKLILTSLNAIQRYISWKSISFKEDLSKTNHSQLQQYTDSTIDNTIRVLYIQTEATINPNTTMNTTNDLLNTSSGNNNFMTTNSNTNNNSITVEIQLKILQTLLLLLSTNIAVISQEDIMSKSFFICFSLHNISFSSCSILANTAAVTIRQIIRLLFEPFNKDESYMTIMTEEDEKELFKKRQVIQFLVFKDLCMTCKNENPTWLKRLIIQKEFGLEIIENILFSLSNETNSLVPGTLMYTVIQEQMLSLLLANVENASCSYNNNNSNTHGQCSFPILVRTMRIYSHFLNNYCSDHLFPMECYTMVHILVEIISNGTFPLAFSVNPPIHNNNNKEETISKAYHNSSNHNPGGSSEEMFRSIKKSFLKIGSSGIKKKKRSLNASPFHCPTNSMLNGASATAMNLNQNNTNSNLHHNYITWIVLLSAEVLQRFCSTSHFLPLVLSPPPININNSSYELKSKINKKGKLYFFLCKTVASIIVTSPPIDYRKDITSSTLNPNINENTENMNFNGNNIEDLSSGNVGNNSTFSTAAASLVNFKSGLDMLSEEDRDPLMQPFYYGIRTAALCIMNICTSIDLFILNHNDRLQASEEDLDSYISTLSVALGSPKDGDSTSGATSFLVEGLFMVMQFSDEMELIQLCLKSYHLLIRSCNSFLQTFYLHKGEAQLEDVRNKIDKVRFDCLSALVFFSFPTNVRNINTGNTVNNASNLFIFPFLRKQVQAMKTIVNLCHSFCNTHNNSHNSIVAVETRYDFDFKYWTLILQMFEVIDEIKNSLNGSNNGSSANSINRKHNNGNILLQNQQSTISLSNYNNNTNGSPNLSKQRTNRTNITTCNNEEEDEDVEQQFLMLGNFALQDFYQNSKNLNDYTFLTLLIALHQLTIHRLSSNNSETQSSSINASTRMLQDAKHIEEEVILMLQNIKYVKVSSGNKTLSSLNQESEKCKIHVSLSTLENEKSEDGNQIWPIDKKDDILISNTNSRSLPENLAKKLASAAAVAEAAAAAVNYNTMLNDTKSPSTRNLKIFHSIISEDDEDNDNGIENKDNETNIYNKYEIDQAELYNDPRVDEIPIFSCDNVIKLYQQRFIYNINNNILYFLHRFVQVVKENIQRIEKFSIDNHIGNDKLNIHKTTGITDEQVKIINKKDKEEPKKYVCWDLITHYLLSLTTHPMLPAASKQFACDSYIQILTTALSNLKKDNEGPNNNFRRVVLQSFGKLTHSGMKEPCERGLAGLSDFVQSAASNNILSAEFWPVIFDLLMCPENITSARTVTMGFDILRYIIDDYFLVNNSNFLFNLEACTECVCSYVVQNLDINISFTAINELWTIADQLSKIIDDRENKNWLYLFMQLKNIAMDKRSEVRNCAINTIFTAAMTHGHNFTYLGIKESMINKNNDTNDNLSIMKQRNLKITSIEALKLDHVTETESQDLELTREKIVHRTIDENLSKFEKNEGINNRDVSGIWNFFLNDIIIPLSENMVEKAIVNSIESSDDQDSHDKSKNPGEIKKKQYLESSVLLLVGLIRVIKCYHSIFFSKENFDCFSYINIQENILANFMKKKILFRNNTESCSIFSGDNKEIIISTISFYQLILQLNCKQGLLSVDLPLRAGAGMRVIDGALINTNSIENRTRRRPEIDQKNDQCLVDDTVKTIFWQKIYDDFLIIWTTLISSSNKTLFEYNDDGEVAVALVDTVIAIYKNCNSDTNKAIPNEFSDKTNLLKVVHLVDKVVERYLFSNITFLATNSSKKYVQWTTIYQRLFRAFLDLLPLPASSNGSFDDNSLTFRLILSKFQIYVDKASEKLQLLNKDGMKNNSSSGISPIVLRDMLQIFKKFYLYPSDISYNSAYIDTAEAIIDSLYLLFVSYNKVEKELMESQEDKGTSSRNNVNLSKIRPAALDILTEVFQKSLPLINSQAIHLDHGISCKILSNLTSIWNKLINLAEDIFMNKRNTIDNKNDQETENVEKKFLETLISVSIHINNETTVDENSTMDISIQNRLLNLLVSIIYIDSDIIPNKKVVSTMSNNNDQHIIDISIQSLLRIYTTNTNLYYNGESMAEKSFIILQKYCKDSVDIFLRNENSSDGVFHHTDKERVLFLLEELDKSNFFIFSMEENNNNKMNIEKQNRILNMIKLIEIFYNCITCNDLAIRHKFKYLLKERINVSNLFKYFIN